MNANRVLTTAFFFYHTGVSVEDRDDGDQTALHRAAGFGHANVVAFLIDANGKVDDADESGSTPLHLAAWRGQVDVLNVLIDRGAKINATGMYGDTALHLAYVTHCVRCLHLRFTRARVGHTNANNISMRMNLHLRQQCLHDHKHALAITHP